MPMRPNVVLNTRDRSAQIKLNLARLAGDRVLVGIPAASAPRKGPEPINNAQLLYIFTNGSILRKQPARPVIEPAINYPPNRKNIERFLRQSAEAEMSGNHADALEHMRKAGLLASNYAKRWFTNPANGWAPNAPSTLRRKAAKAKAGPAKTAFLAAIASGGDTNEYNTVGVDLDEMRRAITYVVRG